MSYRIGEPKPKPKNRSTQKTTTPTKVYVTNGSTAFLAYPCWYLDARPPKHAHMHSKDRHDHFGWPSPSHPDHSCQPHRERAVFTYGVDHDNKHHIMPVKPSIDLSRLTPIHLLKEGYETVEVVLHEGTPEGVTAVGEIDEHDDWIIRVTFDVDTDEAIDEVVECPFAVRVLSDDRKDVALKGVLVIQPAVV